MSLNQTHRINLSRMWQVVCIDGARCEPTRFDLNASLTKMPTTIERQFNKPTNLGESKVTLVLENFPSLAMFQLNESELQNDSTTAKCFRSEATTLLQRINTIRVNLPAIETWPEGMRARLEITAD